MTEDEMAWLAKSFIDSALRWHPVFDDGRGPNNLTQEETSALLCKRLARAFRPAGFNAAGEENETTNEYVKDNGQFGAGA